MQMIAFLLRSPPPTPIPTSLLVPKLHQLLLTSIVRQHRQPNQTARGGKKAILKGQSLRACWVTGERKSEVECWKLLEQEEMQGRL